MSKPPMRRMTLPLRLNGSVWHADAVHVFIAARHCCTRNLPRSASGWEGPPEHCDELDTARNLLRTARHESDIDTPTPSRARTRPRWAMSEKDLDAIRCAYADLNRRDVEAWLDAFDPNAEMYDLAGGPEAPPRRGHDALREWVEEVDEIWEDGRYEPEEFIVAGDFVVVAVRVRARRRDTRLRIDVSMFQVFEMRDGRIQRGRAYLDKDEALEAVGLSE